MARLGRSYPATRIVKPRKPLIVLDDLFNRVDAGNLGAQYVDRAGGFAIGSNTAYPTTVSTYNFATHVTVMPVDDMEVSIIVGPATGTGQAVLIPLGANTAGECALFYADGANAIIYSISDWALTGAVSQASTTTALAATDKFTMRRLGNKYTVLKNSVSLVNWTDSTNVVPRNASHRLAGLGSVRSSGADYWTIDSWRAVNL